MPLVKQNSEGKKVMETGSSSDANLQTETMNHATKVKKVNKRCKCHHNLGSTLKRNALERIMRARTRLNNTPTISSLDIPVTVKDVTIPEEQKPFNMNVANPQYTRDGRLIHEVVVRSREVGDVGVEYKICNDETFDNIYHDYAARVDLDSNDIKLVMWSDHRVVDSTVTPAVVGLLTSDVLFVLGQPGVLNLNTRNKVFYITEVSRNEMEQKFEATPDTYFNRFFHVWAMKVNVDPTQVVFMHERKYITTVHTIADADIRNDDRVVAFVNELPPDNVA